MSNSVSYFSWFKFWQKTQLSFILLVMLGAFGLSIARGITPVSAATTGSAYTALSPYRLLDTRLTKHPLVAGIAQNLTVTGVDGVPADATAVALNVTITGPTAPSFLSVYPAGGSRPNVSNLNFSAGETIANLAVVQIGTGSQVSFFNDAGTTQLIVDLEGYFVGSSGSSSAGSYVPLTPQRITDTRPGSGQPNSGHTIGQGQTLNVQVAGAGGIPSTGASAAILNVTVTDTTAASFMTAYPTGHALPLASNLNWPAGQTLANRVIVPLGTNGQVSFYNKLGKTDLVVDVDGYFTNGSTTPAGASLYYPMSPTRLLDTRSDGGTLAGGSYLPEQFAGVDGISANADAVIANLTETNATAPSYFSWTPSQTRPATSDLNFLAEETVPNLTVPTLNSGGADYIFSSQGTADAIVDVFGYFQPESGGSSAPSPCTSVTLSGSGSSSSQGTPYAVSASAVCPGTSSANYEYFYQPSFNSAWVLAQSWTTSKTYSYPTSGWSPGTYRLAVWASSSDAYQSVSALSSPINSVATSYVSGVTYSAQIYSMTCEEAALEMALSHEGIHVSQQQILNTEGVNESVPGVGPAYTRADPMVNFVGYPNGSEAAGYEPGAYYGAIVRAAQGLGGQVIADGEGISPAQVYDYVDEGHPVEVWVTFNFHVSYGTSWLTNGVHTWPWAGPDGHVVTIVGINNGSVEIDNPWPVGTYGSEYYGADKWVPMSTFRSVYAVYGDMAVVLN